MRLNRHFKKIVSDFWAPEQVALEDAQLSQRIWDSVNIPKKKKTI